MSKNNEEFFRQKTEWAEIKDSLLQNYLYPYAVKLLKTGRPLIYIDGFAGRGDFDDGKDGSPLIACKELNKALETSKAKHPRIKKYFIEKKYASELRTCLSSYVDVEVIDGSFSNLEEVIKERLNGNENLFLYVDPFGIKYLDMDLFQRLPKVLPSVEVLINFNSFGFFREACRVRGVEVTDIQFFDELIERDPEFNPGDASERLNKILGSDGWRDVVEQYKRKEIKGSVAERKIADLFRNSLSKSYDYVLNFPIRLKEGQQPKYRMLHACQHADGAMLMYENMDKNKQKLFDLQQGGQQSLFEQSVENEYIDMDEISSALQNHLASFGEPVHLNILIASYVAQKDVAVSLKSLKGLLEQFETNGIIEILRDPPLTPGRKPSTFMTERKGQYVYIRSLQ